MLEKANKGISLIEVIVSITILMILMQMTLIVTNKSFNAYNEQLIHYSAMSIKYDLLQIIKSDSFFCEHPELYFDNSEGKIKFNKTGSKITLDIYFDDNIKVVDSGFARLNALITCTIFTYNTHTLFYYSIQMKQRVLGASISEVGGITYFYKMDKK